MLVLLLFTEVHLLMLFGLVGVGGFAVVVGQAVFARSRLVFRLFFCYLHQGWQMRRRFTEIFPFFFLFLAIVMIAAREFGNIHIFA